MSAIFDLLKQQDWIGLIIAGLVGALLSLLLNYLKSFFVSKRKTRCISKHLSSSAIYRNLEKGALKVLVTYKNRTFFKPISFLRVRLRNDGEEDIQFRNCLNRPIYVTMEDYELVDVVVDSDYSEVKPKIEVVDANKYALSWDMLKKDESINLTLVVVGEVKDLFAIKFDIRADGIEQIKTPEVRVKEGMLPAFVAVGILSIPILLFMPNDLMAFEVMSVKLVLLLVLTFLLFFYWILCLYERIRWLKEK